MAPLPEWSPPIDALPLRRGERNNNPGNIVYDKRNIWVGQMGIEYLTARELAAGETRRFCRFSDPTHGIRALAKLLHAYVERDGCTTLRAIIERWAPSRENKTDAYVAAVASEVGTDPDAPVHPDPTDYAEWTRAIIHHEQGRVIYSDVMIADEVGEALAS